MAQPALTFRPPVVVTANALAQLCLHAKRGYEAKWKRETYGFLYGRLCADRRLVIRKAVYYRGGSKSRTGVSFCDRPSVLRLLQRRRELAQRFRLRFLGGFHSHVEIAGTIFCGFSATDRDSFRRDTEAALEAVVTVWAGGRPRRTVNSLSVYEPATGYSYRLRLYGKRKDGIRLVRAVLGSRRKRGPFFLYM